MHTLRTAILTLLTAIAVTLVAGFISGWQDPQIKLLPDAGTKALQLLAGLMFATLVVERVIEILIGKPREAATAPQTAAAAAATAALKDAKAAHADYAANIAAGAAIVIAPPALPPLETAAAVAAREVEVAKTVTMNWSLLMGFALGAMLSACGVRTLAELWTTSPPPAGTTPPDFHWTFNSLDLFITAAFISGGSQGLHLLLTTFGKYLEEAKKNT